MVNDVQSLWSAALELFFHQILFTRRLYPKETFTSARFLGAQCRVNRHPDVVSYISEAVNVVVPAIFDGVCNEVSLEIFESQGNSSKRERFFLELSKLPSEKDSVADIERDMQYLILSVNSLEGNSLSWRSSASFKIQLFVSGEEQNSANFNEGFAKGQWFCPHVDSKETRAKEQRCPVYDMRTSTVSFSFSVN